MASNFAKESSDLQNKILFTLFILVVCRIGAFVPVPGIDSFVLSQVKESHSSGILGMFNMLSGGSLGRMSIFALAIMPYITSSIVMQLLSMSYRPLEDLKKEGEAGKRKMNQLTRYLTVLLAIVESYAISSNMYNMSSGNATLVVVDKFFFKISAVTSMVVGTMILMWLGEQINLRGFGNGTSLIIFSGIVSSIPGSLISAFELVRVGSVSAVIVLLVFAVVLALVFVIIFVERAHRKVPVQYPKKQVGSKVYGGEVSHMPLKLNTASVIPPIFANAILSFPLTIANFSSNSDSIVGKIGLYLSHGTFLYVLLYSFLIVSISFLYTAVVFNSQETAENLRKYGAYVPGRRPGQDTVDFFDYLLVRLTCLGSIYLVLICVVPEVLMSKYSAVLLSFSGTSILIVVNVVMDTFTQMQTHMLSKRYDSLMKKAKLREKKS
jgi:preprotein translocase subunit SecY